MNILNVNSLNRYKDYLVIENNKTRVIFSTAEEGKNFNRHTEEGVKTLQNLKEEFNVNDVVYLRQIHSDKVCVFDGKNRDEFIENEGDSIITNVKKVAIGAFTADCVPVLLVDEEKCTVAAIHSGWKGTYLSITQKTIEKMREVYGSDPKNIKAYIGPHIRQCCYEISEELKEKFLDEKNISEDKLFEKRKLNMELCIEEDLKLQGIKDENIYNLGLCTYCSNEVKLHSYRKSNGSYGRLFSFIIIK